MGAVGKVEEMLFNEESILRLVSPQDQEEVVEVISRREPDQILDNLTKHEHDLAMRFELVEVLRWFFFVLIFLEFFFFPRIFFVRVLLFDLLSFVLIGREGCLLVRC